MNKLNILKVIHICRFISSHINPNKRTVLSLSNKIFNTICFTFNMKNTNHSFLFCLETQPYISFHRESNK